MVNMNEDFGAYKDSIWKGLTARELGVMAVSAVSCGIIIILLYFILGWNDVGVKTINKFNPIPYSTLKNSYFVVYRRGLGNI